MGNGRKCKRSIRLSESWGGWKNPKSASRNAEIKLQLGEMRLLGKRYWQLGMKRQKEMYGNLQRREEKG